MDLNDTISFTCAACGHTAEFPKVQEGKAIYCPQCQAAQVVKGPVVEVERISTGRIAKAENAPGTDRIVKSAGGTPSRIDFHCSACNHNARISANLSGQPVRCPSCGTVQLAGVAGMRVVRLDANGKLPFTCTACAYQARLNSEYAGKAIRCPKCQGAQVVPRLVRDASAPEGKPPGTGSIRKDPPPPPVARLRTPASGTPALPPPPPPGPGALQTPLPEPLAATTIPRTPLPVEVPTPAPEPALPAAVAGVADEPKDNGFDPSSPAAEPTRGGVVRRSGRMNAPRTPPPPPSGAEPTLEAARAVQVAAEGHAPESAPEKAPARPLQTRPPWLVPVLGVAAVVLLISVVMLAFLYVSALGRIETAGRQLRSVQQDKDAVSADLKTAKQEAADANLALKSTSDERDQARKDLDAQRKETDRLKTEAEALKGLAAAKKAVEDERDQLRKDVERLKAEAAAKKAAESPAPEPKPRSK